VAHEFGDYTCRVRGIPFRVVGGKASGIN
jgi:hypothetical protein